MFLIAQEMAKSKIFTVSVIFLTCWYDVYYTRFFLLSLFVPGPAQNSSVIPFMVRDVVGRDSPGFGCNFENTWKMPLEDTKY